MLKCMRTTIDLEDDLLVQIKQLAADSNRTIRAVIEDALRADLARRRAHRHPGPDEKVITFKGSGVRPGVNLDSMSELLDIMDGVP